MNPCLKCGATPVISRDDLRGICECRCVCGEREMMTVSITPKSSSNRPSVVTISDVLTVRLPSPDIQTPAEYIKLTARNAALFAARHVLAPGSTAYALLTASLAVNWIMKNQSCEQIDEMFIVQRAIAAYPVHSYKLSDRVKSIQDTISCISARVFTDTKIVELARDLLADTNPLLIPDCWQIEGGETSTVVVQA